MRRAHSVARGVHADHEQLALLVIERPQIHVFRQRFQPPLQRLLRKGRAQQQRRGQIARIDRGHIARRHGLFRADVIPVIELPAPCLQPFERGCGLLQPARTFRPVDQPHKPRRGARDHVQPDVCGRCAFSRAARRVELHIVGHKAVFRRVLGKKAPCPRRQITKHLRIAAFIDGRCKARLFPFN